MKYAGYAASKNFIWSNALWPEIKIISIDIAVFMHVPIADTSTHSHPAGLSGGLLLQL